MESFCSYISRPHHFNIKLNGIAIRNHLKFPKIAQSFASADLNWRPLVGELVMRVVTSQFRPPKNFENPEPMVSGTFMLGSNDNKHECAIRVF